MATQPMAAWLQATRGEGFLSKEDSRRGKAAFRRALGLTGRTMAFREQVRLVLEGMDLTELVRLGAMAEYHKWVRAGMNKGAK